MNFKTCTPKPYSFLVIDATLVLDNPSLELEVFQFFAFASVLYIAIGITNLSKVLKI